MIAEMKGQMQPKYLIISEAKDAATKRVGSFSGKFEYLGKYPGITEELVKDIENYNEEEGNFPHTCQQ